VERIQRIVPIEEPRLTGQVGQPRKLINAVWLKNAMSAHRNISITALAKALGIHRLTLRRHLGLHGVYRHFSAISDPEIDTLVRHLKTQKPGAGLRYVIGFFRKHGIRIQKRRVRMSLRRTDGLGQALRNHQAINRREYRVPRPNSLWHMDGHHKLIRWGIVVHGIIDGYCRTVSSA
jgi:hypothetical protein